MMYRIRWALVYVRPGFRMRMCIAERKAWFFWWPVDGDWRATQEGAMRDIEHDCYLRLPLPAPHEFKS